MNAVSGGMTDAAMNDQFGGSGFKKYGEAIASGY
jgi:hypothetical protein